MLPTRETLEIEFKSDRNILSDNEIVEVVVSLANTNGGVLYLGVEDDGKITGVQPARKDVLRIAAMVAGKTTPSQSVEVIWVEQELPVLEIRVPMSRTIVSTTAGKVLRRRKKADGTPESTPLYPHEYTSRLADFGQMDYSSQALRSAVLEDLDPLERQRLRSIIQSYRGDAALLDLSDEELDRALQLVRQVDGHDIPTVAGLLLIGKEERIKQLLPTAGLDFQVLEGSGVRQNTALNKPILATFEAIQDYIKGWNPEKELMMGFYRMSIPEFDGRAFREAVVNAFSHRDYTIHQRIRIQIDEDGLQVNSPGGFLEGITLDTLLSAEPRSRNPALADALKRIGLAERTGRGVDRIYEGALQYGRPLPSYQGSDATNVRLIMPRAKPDEAFIRMLSEAASEGMQPLNVYALIVLYELRTMKRVAMTDLAQSLHFENYRLSAALQRLMDAGLVESSGKGRGTHYMLSAKVSRDLKRETEYVRQSDIEQIRYPELVMKLAKSKKEITRSDVMKLLNVTPSQSYRLLKKMIEDESLEMVGTKRLAVYRLKRGKPKNIPV